MEITFGEGTDIDTWRNLFRGLEGYTVRITLGMGYEFDIEFVGVEYCDMGELVFTFYRENEQSERVGPLRSRHVDSVKAIHIY